MQDKPIKMGLAAMLKGQCCELVQENRKLLKSKASKTLTVAERGINLSLGSERSLLWK
jgi:hypothetical protein